MLGTISCVRQTDGFRISGAELAHFRKNILRLTQEQMAKRLGLERATYKNYEYLSSIPESLLPGLRALGFFLAPNAPMEVRENGPTYGDDTKRRADGAVQFPIRGQIGGVLVGEDLVGIEHEVFSSVMLSHRVSRFFVRILGDANLETWEPGDLALIHPDPNCSATGHYVCAETSHGLQVGILVSSYGRTLLVPENSAHSPSLLPDPKIKMLGLVVGQRRSAGAGRSLELVDHTGLRPRSSVMADVNARAQRAVDAMSPKKNP